MKLLNGRCCMASYPKASMKASLAKLSQLPATTRIFCGHEYTVSFGGYLRMVGELERCSPIGNDGCLSGVSHQPGAKARPEMRSLSGNFISICLYIFPIVSVHFHQRNVSFCQKWQMDRRTKKTARSGDHLLAKMALNFVRQGCRWISRYKPAICSEVTSTEGVVSGRW